MNKRLKRVIVAIFAAFVVCTGVCAIGRIASNADEVEHIRYERDNHLGLDSADNLVITRNELDNIPMGEEDSWTLFIYLCGSDLESGNGAASADIAEMLAADMNENINIVIQTGGAQEWQEYGIDANRIQRYLVKEDTLELIETKKNASMAESATFEEFVKWGVEKYPAEHMGMIVWNHGGGSIYGACSDENYEGMLTLSEFELALHHGTKNMTDRFEFIGFDACLMATIETANTFVPYADYMIASEESESAQGWEYTSIVNTLSKNPDCDMVTLGKCIIDSYMQRNIEEATQDMATLSMTDLSKIDNILVEFNKVAKKMYELGNTKEDLAMFTKLAKASENYSEGYGFDMIDFTDFMLNIEDLIPEAGKVAKMMEEAIVYEKHGENFVDTKGLSFYYCYGNTTMSDINILRNITISPYLLNFIEKISYGATHDSSLDGYVSNNWHLNDKYYYDSDYGFVRYEFQSMLDYSEELCNSRYFPEAEFDDIWFKWFDYAEYINSDDLEYISDDELDDEDFSDCVIPIGLNIGSGINLHGVTLTNELDLDIFKNIATANYKLIVDNGDSMNIVGDLGEIESEATYTGKWFALDNGALIAASKVNEGNGLTMYKALVLLDDKESYIYFIVDKYENTMILASCETMDKKNKCANRIAANLNDASKIAPIYTNVNYETGKVVKTYGEECVASTRGIQVVELEESSFAIETMDAFGKISYR